MRGREIAFVPRIPWRGDLADAGFQPGARYRLIVPGEDPENPERPVLRTRGGRGLEEDVTFDFEIRDFEPLFFDENPQTFEVRSVAIDLDGDAALDADGRRGTSNSEEFPGSGFDPDRLLATGVRTGSLSLPAPNGPLVLGFFLSEPVDPRTFHAAPGEPPVVAFERDRLFPCEDPPGGLCPRTIPLRAELRNEFVVAEDRFRTVVLLTLERPLKESEPHGVTLESAITDLFGEAIA